MRKCQEVYTRTHTRARTFSAAMHFNSRPLICASECRATSASASFRISSFFSTPCNAETRLSFSFSSVSSVCSSRALVSL